VLRVIGNTLDQGEDLLLPRSYPETYEVLIPHGYHPVSCLEGHLPTPVNTQSRLPRSQCDPTLGHDPVVAKHTFLVFEMNGCFLFLLLLLIDLFLDFLCRLSSLTELFLDECCWLCRPRPSLLDFH
jgi:hypothetical protein